MTLSETAKPATACGEPARDIEQLAGPLSHFDTEVSLKLQDTEAVRAEVHGDIPEISGANRAPAARGSDSVFGAGIDSPDPQIRSPETFAASNRNESDEGYSRLVAALNDKWRVIECRDRIQWILQSRDTAKSKNTGAWRGRSY